MKKEKNLQNRASHRVYAVTRHGRADEMDGLKLLPNFVQVGCLRMPCRHACFSPRKCIIRASPTLFSWLSTVFLLHCPTSRQADTTFPPPRSRSSMEMDTSRVLVPPS